MCFCDSLFSLSLCVCVSSCASMPGLKMDVSEVKHGSLVCFRQLWRGAPRGWKGSCLRASVAGEVCSKVFYLVMVVISVFFFTPPVVGGGSQDFVARGVGGSCFVCCSCGCRFYVLYTRQGLPRSWPESPECPAACMHAPSPFFSFCMYDTPVISPPLALSFMPA